MSRKKNKLECKLERDRARYILTIRILEEKKRESHCGQRGEKTVIKDREHEERKREKGKTILIKTIGNDWILVRTQIG